MSLELWFKRLSDHLQDERAGNVVKCTRADIPSANLSV
jgi:hypothetical protein